MASELARWHTGAAARGVLRRDLERVAAGTVPPRSVDQRAAVMLLDILEEFDRLATRAETPAARESETLRMDVRLTAFLRPGGLVRLRTEGMRTGLVTEGETVAVAWPFELVRVLLEGGEQFERWAAERASAERFQQEPSRNRPEKESAVDSESTALGTSTETYT